MKWPQRLILIRHAESAYNALKQRMRRDDQYLQFVQAYAHDPQSKETRIMAELLHQRYPVKHSDMQTPLAAGADYAAENLGRRLRQSEQIPDVVYVSPYIRTWATLSGILKGWPELAKVRVIEEERIREQEFGMRILFSDWRLFFALNPEQCRLQRLQGPYWYRFPQGENVPDVRNRNRNWMTSLTRDFGGKRVLAITHHMNILAFRANMERLSSHQFIEMEREHAPANCSITVYRGDPSQGVNGRLLLESYDQRLSDQS